MKHVRRVHGNKRENIISVTLWLLNTVYLPPVSVAFINFYGPPEKVVRTLKPSPFVQTGPEEFLYKDKYKVLYREGAFVCDLCSRRRKERRRIAEHINAVHILRRGWWSWPRGSICHLRILLVFPFFYVERKATIKPLRVTSIGPNEFLLDGKHRFFQRGGFYYCGECDASRKFGTPERLMIHVRRVHVNKRKHIMLTKLRWPCWFI